MLLLVFLLSVCQPIQIQLNKPGPYCQQQPASTTDKLMIAIHSTDPSHLKSIRLLLTINNTEMNDYNLK